MVDHHFSPSITIFHHIKQFVNTPKLGYNLGVEEREWVKNFVPNSTAREIVLWLLKTSEGKAPVTQDQFAESLTRFKQETGLKEIDLLQLREYAEFEARLVSKEIDDPRRIVRHQIAQMAVNLVQQDIRL